MVQRPFIVTFTVSDVKSKMSSSSSGLMIVPLRTSLIASFLCFCIKTMKHQWACFTGHRSEVTGQAVIWRHTTSDALLDFIFELEKVVAGGI